MISVINYFSALIWLYGRIIFNEWYQSDCSCLIRARFPQHHVTAMLLGPAVLGDIWIPEKLRRLPGGAALRPFAMTGPIELSKAVRSTSSCSWSEDCPAVKLSSWDRVDLWNSEVVSNSFSNRARISGSAPEVGISCSLLDDIFQIWWSLFFGVRFLICSHRQRQIVESISRPTICTNVI